MPANQSIVQDLVTANRILANEGILDGFGHVSVRHPERANRFLISKVCAPGLVTSADIIELDLDGRPVVATDHRLFAERVIHGCVYALRPDVMAVCHHHAPAVLPFCVSGIELVPVVHLGATMGARVPFWDSQDEFGDTDLLVSTHSQGMSLARALGDCWTVLLRRHGAAVAGRSLRELVFRTIYGAHNALILREAMLLGHAPALTLGEATAAGEFNLTPIALDRNWERWSRRASAGV